MRLLAFGERDYRRARHGYDRTNPVWAAYRDDQVWSVDGSRRLRDLKGGVMAKKERRPYHLYPLLGLVLLAAMAVGLYFRVKRPPRRADIAG